MTNINQKREKPNEAGKSYFDVFAIISHERRAVRFGLHHDGRSHDRDLVNRIYSDLTTDKYSA